MLTADDFTDLWNPRYPLASNDPKRLGSYRRTRSDALNYRLIETTAKQAPNCITLDFDHPQASWAVKSAVWEEGIIPEPSVTTVSRASGHAHIRYNLAGFMGTKAARDYRSDLAQRLRAVIGADARYTELLTSNPFHDAFITEWGTDHLYTLAELEPFAALTSSTQQATPKESGEGRNSTTFETVRTWAYKQRKFHQHYDSFLKAVNNEVHRFHDYFYPSEQQLKSSELHTIARSIAGWTWKHITQEGFSQLQAFRSSQAPHVKAAPERYRAVLALTEAGLTAREVGKNMQLSKEAAKQLIRRARAWGEKRK